METKKKRKVKNPGFRLKDLILLVAILGTFFFGWMHIESRFVQIERKFEQIDRRFEKVDERFNKIDERLDRIEGDVKKTGDLLNAYLTWRFIDVGDPVRRHLIPVYDPGERTLGFVDLKRDSGKVTGILRPNEFDF